MADDVKAGAMDDARKPVVGIDAIEGEAGDETSAAVATSDPSIKISAALANM
jgi:hypothetical protein